MRSVYSETARLNKAAAERSFEDNGHGLGKMLRGTYEHKVMGDSVFSHILSYTSGACDASYGRGYDSGNEQFR